MRWLPARKCWQTVYMLCTCIFSKGKQAHAPTHIKWQVWQGQDTEGLGYIPLRSCLLCHICIGVCRLSRLLSDISCRILAG